MEKIEILSEEKLSIMLFIFLSLKQKYVQRNIEAMRVFEEMLHYPLLSEINLKIFSTFL